MQALQDKINELVGEKIASGDLDELIKKKLDKTIDDILEDLLRSWSPFGKSLKEQLEAGLNVNLDLGIGGYNQLVADIVAQRLESALHGRWKADLEAQVDEMLRAAPATIKLSELLARLAETYEREAADEEWESATMLVETSEYGSRWVYLDPKPRSSADKYRFMWSMLLTDEGEISSVRHVDFERHHHGKEMFGGRRYGMENVLFHLHAGKTKVVCDLREGIHEHEYPEREHCSC